MKHFTFCVFFLSAAAVLYGANDNIAPKAAVSASSEYSNQYLAPFVTDGFVPDAGSRNDTGKAWCVRNETANNRGEITFQWNEPTAAAEIVYFGRTAWFETECWKDYQVFADNQNTPIAFGTLRKTPEPQQITFTPQKIQTLKIVFLNSYGGPNPGASEIMIFPKALDTAEFKKLRGKRSANSPEVLAEIDTDTQNFLTQGFDKILAVKRYEIRASHVYTYHYEGFKAGGGLYVFDVNELKGNPNAEGRLLVPTPAGQILSADLSYDGQTILFAWRRQQSEAYHLWSINVDGSGLKQLTDGPKHDYDACWLPDGDIAFLCTKSPQFAYCWNAPVGILHRMHPDGSNLIQLSGNYLNDFTPSVLDDGRIIYSRWEYVDKPAIPIQSLWTIHPNGTHLQVFFGNRVLSPETFMQAQQIPGTQKIVCAMTGHGGLARGGIGIIDRQHGINTQASIRNITPDVNIAKVNEGGGDNTWGRTKKIYSFPYPLDSERFLVSANGPILVRTFDIDSTTKQPLASATLLPKPADGMEYFSAQPIRPRTKPPVLGNALTNNKFDYATLAVQDVYQGLGSDVKRGEVAAIRVVREMQKTVRIEPHLRSFGFQFPTISCGATYAGKMILGDVPVAEDGSAHFIVKASGFDNAYNAVSVVSSPVTGPIYFIALDKEGRAIQRMRSFTHLMPGEEQTCVGCHDSRTTTPIQTAKFTKAATQQPLEPKLPDWAKVSPDRAAFSPGFDYVRTIQPIWNRYCTECHNAKDAPKNVDLTGSYTDYFNVSYETLASENQGRTGSPYVNWIPTYNGQEQNILHIKPKEWGSYRSPLAELIRSGHTDEKGNKRFEMDDASKRKIFAWIDLNVPYYGSSETSHPDALGCRRIYPKELDTVLNEVGGRRCAECHSKGNAARKDWIRRTQNQFQHPQENADGIVPRRSWVRITEPELNPFLLAPLAKSAGGTERCGRVIFADKGDPDYCKILEVFKPIEKSLAEHPRIDMPNGRPAEKVCRLTD
ncbi:MAG: hypothetical protein LBT89_03840 [Planctomycetaceae bacterium]|nr:hypothetical protein [Planctomycetaceae bacterium]